MTYLSVILAAFATYRLTRIVTADFITERFREWVDARSKWFGYLISCDWCLSVWIAPAPTVAILLWPDNRFVIGALVALTASAATGLVSTWERATEAE